MYKNLKSNFLKKKSFKYYGNNYCKTGFGKTNY